MVVIHKGQIGNIYEIRGVQVMLDADLAQLYGVKTKVLNQAVARNSDRFPQDFAFKFTQKELSHLKSQFVTSSWGGRRKLPTAFTEHGILMLSSVLRSNKAVEVNIQIMRSFISLRKSLVDYQQLKEKIEELEQNYDKKFSMIFDAIKRLIDLKQEKEKKKIGFITTNA